MCRVREKASRAIPKVPLIRDRTKSAILELNGKKSFGRGVREIGELRFRIADDGTNLALADFTEVVGTPRSGSDQRKRVTWPDRFLSSSSLSRLTRSFHA